jgi:hypothetical protein
VLPGADDFVIVCFDRCQGKSVGHFHRSLRGRARVLTALGALAVASFPRTAEARDVAYRAPAECPAAAEVEGRLEAAAPNGTAARVAIEKTRSGFHGEVSIGDGRVVRRVDARSCGAVVEALELALALRSDDVSGELSTTAAPSANAHDDATPAPAPVREPEPEPSPALAERDAPAVEPPSAERRVWTFGSSFSYSSFSERRSLTGGALFADLALPTRLGDVSILHPSLRVSLGGTFPDTRTGRRDASAEGGSTACADCGPRVTIVKGAIDVCPVGINLEGSLSLSVCGRGELGVIFADVSGTSATAPGRPWVAAGPVVRPRFTWGSGSIRPMFEVTAGLLAPLRRDRFHFDAYPTEAAAPWIWTIGFGGGIVFP